MYTEINYDIENSPKPLDKIEDHEMEIDENKDIMKNHGRLRPCKESILKLLKILRNQRSP